jgi:hypothetical protein
MSATHYFSYDKYFQQREAGTPCMPCCFVCHPCQPGPQAISLQSVANPEVVEEYMPAQKPEPIVKKEYIPFERKVIEYIEEEVEVQEPVQRTVI